MPRTDAASCPVCGGQRLHALFPEFTGRCVTSQMQFLDGMTFANRCCLGCGFIFNARGTRQTADALYTAEQWKPKPQVLAFDKNIAGDKDHRAATDDKGVIGQQERAFATFRELHDFAPTGRLLDFGAGTGRFLEHFRAHYPQWELFGIEPGGGYAEHATRIPAATSWNRPYHDITLPHRMDVIVVMSVLEHVEDPLHALRWIADNLAEDGVALLQHPDFAHLPGDLLCIDHIGKLTVPHTTALCAHAGLRVTAAQEGKVLFALRCAKAAPVPLAPQVEAALGIAQAAERVARASVACVGAALDAAAQCGGRAAVFGTSPVGCMARRILGHQGEVACFVDENPNTWGREQDGIPVLGPDRMAALGITDLALAISPVYWQMVAEKMRAYPVRVHVPDLEAAL